MHRLCERPTCSEAAVIAWGFDRDRHVVWLDVFDPEAPVGGGLCRYHADHLGLPRGWWLEDRRRPEALFAAEAAPPGSAATAEPDTAVVPPAEARPARRRGRGRAASSSEAKAGGPAAEPGPASAPVGVAAPGGEPAVADQPPEAEAEPPAAAEPVGPEPEAAQADQVAVEAGVGEGEERPERWTEAFAAVDDAPVFDATSPLLARAFGKGPAPEPPRRRRRRPADPEPSSEAD